MEKEKLKEVNTNDIEEYINKINSYLKEEKSNLTKEETNIGFDISKKRIKKSQYYQSR